MIPAAKDPERRAKCEADDCLWLQTYCADVFYNPFTPHQKKIIEDCGRALRYGTLKCTAAPRGDGKSSIVKYLMLKYALTRQVRFPLMIAATASKAKKALASLKRRLAARADTPLSEDYPLECHVARYVDPWPSRARNVTANGFKPIHVEWGADWFILPTWEEQEPLGPILFAIGITSDELQGCNVYDQRPDFVMLDDLDSRDSLAAEDGVVAAKIEEAIDKTVAGLGGQSRRLGQFMLCTITSRDSAAFRYSSPAIKAAFSGERIPAIIEWPENIDLWNRYVELRQIGKSTLDDDGQPEDVFGRTAHRFYLDNREAMDAGAVLANPYNFEPDMLPDGSQKQVSALQRCYDYIADSGKASFLTEHQNDPPEDEGARETNITPHRIQRSVSGYDRRQVPPGCRKLVHAIDCSKSYLHWVVRAFRLDGTGYTIDYGTTHVVGTRYGSDDGVDMAVRRAIIRRMDEMRETEYVADDGEILKCSLTLVDAGWKSRAVYSACKAIGKGIMPLKGFGKSSGCVAPNFTEFQRKTKDKQPGDGYFISKRANGMLLVCSDADRWKSHEHDRWMTAPDQIGSMQLFGVGSGEKELSRDEREHEAYAKQICNEVEVEELTNGRMRNRWRAKGANHWLDASAYSHLAARIVGVRLLRDRREPKIEVGPETPNTKEKESPAKPATAHMPRAKKGRVKRKLRKATYL